MPSLAGSITECHHTLMPGKELVQTEQQKDYQGFAFCLSAGSMRWACLLWANFNLFPVTQSEYNPFRGFREH